MLIQAHHRASSHLTADFHSVHFDLPVAVSGDGQVGEVARVVLGIAATQDQLAALLARRVSADTAA